MSYKSHKKSPNRAFDHLYDLTNKSTASGMRVRNFKALGKSAPLHIIPCYSSMFSDLITKRRNFYFQQRNPLPLNPCELQNAPTIVCNRSINTNMFIHCPVIQEEEFNCTDEPSYPKFKDVRSVKCQTIFRESSAQTDPWLPEASLREGEKSFPEILTVYCDLEPGISEITEIERARVRRQWENLLPSINSDELPLRLAQLEAFEWENLVARERKLNQIQIDRMEQVFEMIEERQENANEFNDAMMENIYQRSISELEKKKLKLNLNHERKLRKLSKEMLPKEVDEFQKIKPERSLMNVLDSSQSLRNLLNSSNLSDQPINIKKRLNSRKNLWEPKEKVKEIAHGVRTERNLKKLCDSLKTNTKREGIRCRTRCSSSSKVTDIQPKYDEKQEDSKEKTELLLSTLKGIQVQNKLMKGLSVSAKKIDKYRKDFSIYGYESLEISKQATSSEINLVIDPIVKSIIESTMKENPKKILKKFVEEILEAVDEIISKITNKNILLQAEEERMKRRNETLNEEKLRLQNVEIKRQIDETQRNCSEEILRLILPSLIEIIAETDAREFILNVAKSIDDEACSYLKSDEEIAHEVIRQILLPEVVKRVEMQTKPDEMLSALVASHDAFEIFMRNFPANTSKVVCENLIEDVLNKIEI